jgi:sugar/nucleoside kinase (ribokinase family)
MDVVGIGLANIDLVAHVDEAFLKRHKLSMGRAQKLDELSFARLRGDLARFDAIPGGCAANVMCGLAAAGVSTGFYGKIGNDSFESLYRSSFTEYMVRYDVAPADSESSQCAVLVTKDGERTFAYIDGASWLLEDSDIDEATLKSAQMICTEIYAFDFGRGQSTARKIFKCAENANVPIVMKVMDDLYAAKYAQKIHALCEAGIITLLVGNHLNMPALTDTTGTDATLAALAGWGCDILITANTGGGYYIAGGEITHYPVKPVEKPKNTTGAGDQFLAGFLTGKLDGRSITECMEHGALCARQILMHDTARPPLVNRHSIRF